MKKILLTIAIVAAVLVITTTTTFAQNDEESSFGFNFVGRMCHNNGARFCHEHQCDENECYEYHVDEQNNNLKQYSNSGRHCHNRQARRGCH